MSYSVYIMSSKSGVLYIGATNDLDRRVAEVWADLASRAAPR